MVLVLILEVLEGLLGLLQDVFPPGQQLIAEILPLAVIHERLFFSRPVVFFFVRAHALHSVHLTNSPCEPGSRGRLIPTTSGRDNWAGEELEGGGNELRRPRQAGPGARRSGGRTHLGELDLDPELYFGQNPVEVRIAGKILEARRRGLELHQGSVIELAGQQPELHLVENIERRQTAFERAPPALFHAVAPLQCEQSIDSADGAHPGCAGRRRLGLLLRQTEGTRGGTARGRRRVGGGRPVGSKNAHGADLLNGRRPPIAASLALQWLRLGKKPARIAGQGATSTLSGVAGSARDTRIIL